MLETGALDFSFNREYDDSCFTHIEEKGQIHNLIDINREFNYNDVLSLVHEFIHFTNGKETVGANWQVLTEFFPSILKFMQQNIYSIKGYLTMK